MPRMLNATPLLRLYARRRLRKLAQMDAVNVQQRLLAEARQEMTSG